MAQKSKRDLILFDPAAIVSYPDEGNPSVPDFHSHCSSLRIDRILQKLFHHGSRTLNDLAGCDLIDGILIQYMNVRHAAPPVVSLLPLFFIPAPAVI